jgi:CBS-domain-containing membrane protein
VVNSVLIRFNFYCFNAIDKTLHPPGGATALIAVTGSEEIKNMGYWYVITPVLSGIDSLNSSFNFQ